MEFHKEHEQYVWLDQLVGSQELDINDDTWDMLKSIHLFVICLKISQKNKNLDILY